MPSAALVLLWCCSGTDEYEEWAAEGENEALAVDDYLALGKAFESEYTDMAERAEKWAEVMMEHVSGCAALSSS